MSQTKKPAFSLLQIKRRFKHVRKKCVDCPNIAMCWTRQNKQVPIYPPSSCYDHCRGCLGLYMILISQDLCNLRAKYPLFLISCWAVFHATISLLITWNSIVPRLSSLWIGLCDLFWVEFAHPKSLSSFVGSHFSRVAHLEVWWWIPLFMVSHLRYQMNWWVLSLHEP